MSIAFAVMAYGVWRKEYPVAALGFMALYANQQRTYRRALRVSLDQPGQRDDALH